MFRDIDYRSELADTLSSLGDVHHAAGSPAAACENWQEALTILTDLGRPDAKDVQDKLRHHDDEPAGIGRRDPSCAASR